MILLLDNYDSFTFNLHHYLEQLSSEEIVVKRNDEITVTDAASYTGIVLSPGPGLPAEAGIMPELIRVLGPSIPILGICLGHQAIGESYGAHLENLENVLHGVQREVIIEPPADKLFTKMPNRFPVGHYHSWVISLSDLPPVLSVTAKDTHGHIMAVTHKEHPISGVQFHPESILTENGMKILENWLHFCKSFGEKRNSAVHSG